MTGKKRQKSWREPVPKNRVVIEGADENSRTDKEGKQNDMNFLVQTLGMRAEDITRCYRIGKFEEDMIRPLVCIMKDEETAANWSAQKIVTRDYSIKRHGSKNQLQPIPKDENYPGPSTIHEQLDDLMETITLSSPLWKGTHGITIPVPVLQKASELGGFLGAGSFGRVYLYEDPRNECKPVAIKRILTNEINMVKKQVEDVRKEVAIHANLKHPNIIQYFGSYVAERHICIMMEHADGGNLREHINNNNGKVIAFRLLHFTKQILLGLNYLHSLPNPIIHRDLRSPNILICDVNTAKLADFGISKQLTTLHSTSGFDTVVGNTFWQAPEMILSDDNSQEKMGKKVDEWSAGIVVLEMLHGKPPQSIELCDNNNRYIRKWVEYSIHRNDEELKALLAPPETLTNQQTMDILKYCLEFKASERKTAAEILNLVWNYEVPAPPQFRAPAPVLPRVHARPPAPVQERPSLELLHSALQQGSEAMRRHANEMQ